MLNQDRASKELQQFRSQTDCTSAADRQFLPLLESKYEQIMSFTENDLHGGRLDTAAVYAVLAGKRNWTPGDGEGALHSYNKRSKCGEQIAKSSSSPGSNNSEVTTEQYMAESSKSSCFDDACTLAVETGGLATGPAAGGESGASTSELVQSYRKNNNEELDLNGIPYGQASLDKRASDLRATTTIATNFSIAEESRQQSLELVSLVKAEEEEGEGSMLLLSSNKRAQTGKGIEYYSSQDHSSWLQLGLGPSSRSPNVPQMARPQVEYARPEEDEADVSTQRKPVLHLFPSESVQISQYNPQRVPTTQPELGHARSDHFAEGSDFYSGTGAYVPPLRFARTAADIETQPREVEDFTGFLKPIKEAPDTQLLISYGNTAPYGHADRLSEAAQRGSSNRLMSMLGESYQPPAYHEGTGAISEAPLHHSYAYDSGFQGSQSSYEDKHFQSRSFASTTTATTGGLHSVQGVGSLGTGKGQDLSNSWKHESFHPFAPSRPAAGGVYLPMTPPFHTGPRNLMPNQPPEDWQTLIKRLGGSIQFQSLFPSMPKAVEGIEELQQQRRSNLRDLQAQWNIQQEGRPTPALTTGSWPRHQILGSGGQDVKTMPAFSFPSFEGSLSSRLSPPPPSLQAWQPSASLLPFLPVSQHHHHQQLIASDTSTSRERRRLSPVVKDHDVWFFLRAGQNQDSEQLLPQIPKGYLRVKDGTVPVSHVKKYLVHKLGLMCESEVEISCRGQILLPSLSLQHVRDVIWYSSSAVCSTAAAQALVTGDHEEQDTSTSTTTTTNTTNTATTAAPRNIVMELNYRRRHPQFGGATS